MTKEERNALCRDWKRQLHDAGLCVTCKREDAYTMAGHWHCYECSQKEAARAAEKRKKEGFNAKRRHRQRALENERRENGLCFRCGKALTDMRYKTCERCRTKIAEYNRLKNNSANYPRGANGICWRCNKNPIMEGHKVCATCYAALETSIEHARSLCDRTNHYWKADEEARRLKWRNKTNAINLPAWNGNPSM